MTAIEEPTSEDPGPDDVPEEYRDPFSRSIAVLAVLTTLLAALVGYMLATSSGHSADAASRAQRLSVEAAGETTRAQQQSQADFETFVLAEEQRTRAANAEQRFLFAGGSGNERRLRVSSDLWRQMAEQTEKLTPLTTGSEFGPDADPVFPARFFTVANQEAYRLGALEDAAKVTSEAWGAQAAGYTAVLTIFAVALYLFGLSLTLGKESRKLFAGVALALVVVGFGWALSVFLNDPDEISDEAADAYAAGEVAFLTAATQADYREAAKQFRETVELRPDFAVAHARLSAAEYRAGSPQVSGYITLSSKEALDIAVSELERARELGLETFEVLASLAAYHFQRGVLNDRPAEFEESAELTEAAMELDPDSEHLRMNLGLAQFASGDEEAARENLRAGAESGDSYLLAATMGVLDLLEDQGPEEVAEQTPAMKEFLAGVTPIPIDGARAPEGIELTDVEAVIFPSSVQLKFGVEGEFDNSQDVLNVFWYHLDEEGLGWSPVPEVSYFQYATANTAAPGDYFIHPPYLTATIPRRCLAAGPYRVEIFAGDELVGSAETETVFTQMEAAAFADLNAAFCRPAGWERVTEEFLARPGMVRGYRSPDGADGVFMFRLQSAVGEIGALPPAERAELMLNFVVQNWTLGLPGTPVYERPEEAYFMGLEGGVQRWYTYPGGRVLAGAGVDADGSVVIGVVHGSDAFFDPAPGNNGGWILDSAIPFNLLVQ